MRNLLLIILVGLFVVSCKSKMTPEQIEARRIEDKQIIEEYKKECERVEKLSKEEDKNARFKKGIPETLDEAVRFLEKKLNKKDVERFRTSDASDLGSLHMGFGMSLRNGWGLWGGRSKLSYFFLSRGITHPDNMSSVIMGSFANYLQGKDYRLEEEKKNPKLMKAFDAVLEDDPEKLQKLIKKDKKLLKKENSKGVSVINLSAILCSEKVIKFLTDEKLNIPSSQIAYGFLLNDNDFFKKCDKDLVKEVIKWLKNNNEMSDRIWIFSSKNKGVISDMCNDIKSIEEENIRDMLIHSISYGSWDDIKCLYEKVPKPFKIKYRDVDKINDGKIASFVVEHLEEFKDKSSLRSFLEEKAIYFPLKALKLFFKKFNVSKDFLKNTDVMSNVSYRNSVEKMKYLQSLGLSIESEEENKNPLHIAVATCSFKNIDFLLDRKVDINRLDREESVISGFFYNQCFNGFNQELLAKYLIVNGLDLNKINRGEGYLPIVLYHAAYRGSGEFFKFLKRRGVNVCIENYNDLLIESIRNQDIEVMKFAILEGYDVNGFSKFYHVTPLVRAVQFSEVEKIKFLLQSGADPNQKVEKPFNAFGREDGLYPIHAALIPMGFASPMVEVVKLLIENGADPKVKTANGFSTFEFAQKIIKKRLKEETEPVEGTFTKCKKEEVDGMVQETCTDEKVAKPPRGESSETKKLKEIVELLKKYE